MPLLKLIPRETAIPFLNYRKFALIASLLLVLGSVGSWLGIGLYTGIDIRGGFLIEVRSTTGPADIPQLRDELGALGLGDVSLQEFGVDTDVVIRVQSQTLEDSESLSNADKAAVALVTQTLGEGYDIRRTEYVGAVVGGELREKAMWAIIAALGAIMIYIWFRFEWPFAVSAILALTHDVITTIGLFAITGFEFNLATVAALLTIAGYSINDTVVVFDRVRENLVRYKTHEIPEILTRSLNETLNRTVMTSITTLLALLSIYLFGGAVLGDFALAMIWGVLIGTYSSIFVATGTLIYFDLTPSDEDDTPVPEYER
ncbi:MAG: protein translocase subunit SecF [Alphaproteobacteria bacterium]|nr:protein translocase subunit SecF [Alphaproteobacteria bacterium]